MPAQAAVDNAVLEENHFLDLKREVKIGKAQNKETARDLAQFALDGGTVITGAESATDALAWADTALGRFGKPQTGTASASLMRPTPDTARLAYMMLASMGA